MYPFCTISKSLSTSNGQNEIPHALYHLCEQYNFRKNTKIHTTAQYSTYACEHKPGRKCGTLRRFCRERRQCQRVRGDDENVPVWAHSRAKNGSTCDLVPWIAHARQTDIAQPWAPSPPAAPDTRASLRQLVAHPCVCVRVCEFVCFILDTADWGMQFRFYRNRWNRMYCVSNIPYDDRLYC